MNHTEAAKLCAYVKQMCPQQAIDEYTPDVWYDLLSDLRFVDAFEAAKLCGRKQLFVAPSEIRVEVRRMREKRIATFGHFDMPPNLPEGEYREQLATMRRRIADGEVTSPDEVRCLSPIQDVTGLRELCSSLGRFPSEGEAS